MRKWKTIWFNLIWEALTHRIEVCKQILFGLCMVKVTHVVTNKLPGTGM